MMRSLFLVAIFVAFDGHVAMAQAPTAALTAFNDATVKSHINTNDSSSGQGAAILKIKSNNNNVQISNYGSNSFKLENVGTKRIAAVFIDVTNSIFSDVVFDSADGSGGDSVTKNLIYDSVSSAANVKPVFNNFYDWLWLPTRDSSFNPTASFNPNQLTNENNLFVDSTADNNRVYSPRAGGGFRGELLLFTAFGAGEDVGFSCDMDGNSLAGLFKGTVDTDAIDGWDVGGVSGSEMINGVVTILFGDGSTGWATLASDGSQSGSIAAIGEGGLASAPVLSVNGVSNGGAGTYSSSRPKVVVSSTTSNIVRVSMVKGFNPVQNTKIVGGGQITVSDLVEARLQAQYPEFPCNNAKLWQHVTVAIPSSGSLDISAYFEYNENLPIAFTAVIVSSNGAPISETADPVRLLYSTTPTAPVAAPVAAPTPRPSVPPTNSPVKAPTNAPVKAPISPAPVVTPAPVKAVTNAPVKAPTDAPVKAPTNAPVKAPTKAPVVPPAPAPVPAPVPSSGPSIVRLVLVNASTDQDIGVLKNGDTVSLESGGINVRADTGTLAPPNECGVALGSVIFAVNGQNVRTENGCPYALAGDKNRDYGSWNISPGVYTIKATPYSGRGGSGTEFASLEMEITVTA